LQRYLLVILYVFLVTQLSGRFYAALCYELQFPATSFFQDLEQSAISTILWMAA
jgi:hypothetical protein